MNKSELLMQKLHALHNHPSTHPNIRANAKAAIDKLNAKGVTHKPAASDEDKHRYKNEFGETHKSMLDDRDYEHESSKDDKHEFKNAMKTRVTLHGSINKPHSFEVHSNHYHGSGKTVDELDHHLFNATKAYTHAHKIGSYSAHMDDAED